MSIECDKVGGINLSQGICDLEVPLPVRMGAKSAIEDGINSYTRYDGIRELRVAIAEKHKRFTGQVVDPENDIIVSAGSTRVITKNTRCVILNTPSNPCGKVFSKKELEFISAFSEQHDLFVFTDEIYEHFIYDGRKHISPVSLPGMKERTISK